MFRLKDYTTVISKFKPRSHVTILDHCGKDIDYNNIGKYIDLLIEKVEFIDMLDGEYCCLTVLSSKSGDRTISRKPIKFSELLNCLSGPDIVVVPFNNTTKDIYWNWVDDNTLHDKNIVNIVPIFSKRHTLLQIYLV